MILVIEPVFPNAHHAPSNAGTLRAIGLAAGNEDVAFAAHPAHRDAVFAILGDQARDRFSRHDIEVIPAGGVSFRRFRSQAGSLIRLTRELRPRLVVCLGTQPETLFACRLLTRLFRTVEVIAVLHGNLHEAAHGWRSRDPRRRWFDNRASLRAAVGGRRIRFVVLESSVRDAAIELGLVPADRTHVWPHAIHDGEVWERPHRPDPRRIRIAFLGSAKRAKGFDDFAAMTRRLSARSDRYEFSLVGGLSEPFPAAEVAHLRVPDGFLDRAAFLDRLHEVDYVCLPLRDDTYTLTVSGAVLDAIAAARPLIALPTRAIRSVFQSGQAGFLCDDLAAMEAVMSDLDRLTDPVAYQGFRTTLEAVRALRMPDALARIVAPQLQRRP